jgi:hypothetical protein
MKLTSAIVFAHQNYAFSSPLLLERARERRFKKSNFDVR